MKYVQLTHFVGIKIGEMKYQELISERNGTKKNSLKTRFEFFNDYFCFSNLD